MKRQLTTSAGGSDTRRRSGGTGTVANLTRSGFNAPPRARSAMSEPRLALASRAVWTHTLVLTGELDHRSAHALEREIERLCEEGVTGITLDLRELTYIDSIGVAVIVFRCGHCTRRGHDFTLISGSPLVQGAFERAGVIDSLPFQREDVAEPPPARLKTAPAPEIMSARTGQAP
jgi:anti-sigma B factor antagonist